MFQKNGKRQHAEETGKLSVQSTLQQRVDQFEIPKCHAFALISTMMALDKKRIASTSILHLPLGVSSDYIARDVSKKERSRLSAVERSRCKIVKDASRHDFVSYST